MMHLVPIVIAAQVAFANPPPAVAPLDDAVDLLVGSFSTAEQAATDAEFFDIRLQMVRIWAPRDRTTSEGAAKDPTPEGERAATEPAAAWLYVEQAAAAAMSRPYRQRIYKVSQEADGTIRSETYTLPGDAMKFAGAWRKPESFDAIKPADLTLKEGCAVLLRRTKEGTFEGGTHGKACPSDRGGASYATSEVTMSPWGLVTLDRGYDKTDQQVWGSTKGGYRFKRVTLEESLQPPALAPETPKPVPSHSGPREGSPTPTKPDLIHPAEDVTGIPKR